MRHSHNKDIKPKTKKAPPNPFKLISVALPWQPGAGLVTIKELEDYIKILGSVLLHKEPKAQRNSAVVEHQIDNVEPVLHFLLLFHCFFPGWHLDYLHI